MNFFRGLFLMMITLLVLTGCNEISGESDESAAEELNWEQSPLFEANGYSMIGEEGVTGFIYEDSEVDRFYPNKIQKYMWHFWESEKDITGKFMVIGTQEKTQEQIEVVPAGRDISRLAPNDGEPYRIPTHMALPKKGMWKLEAKFDDQVVGTVYVEVHDY
ncbi:DUF4871 domain-containing protein [Planomicrobium sp. Y74]|uniref:DUF4871 domain-containing protein n=1 Tax=Planomicrobium sp. Y74 TaxID=2478977 RepID=UPI002570D4EB|nr:DUF4871 domain-containing protein [Planomicrobium sp. Y74]